MSLYTEVPASEMEVGQVIYPHRDFQGGCFRIDSIEKTVDNGKDFLTFRGHTLQSKVGYFKCYPTRIVEMVEGKSTMETINEYRASRGMKVN
jgi:hypothetical protein